MKRHGVLILTVAVLVAGGQQATAYPPGVGILGKAKDCLVCHVNNGLWKDDATTVIDIVDKETNKSLKQADGSFLIQAKRGELKTVLTVIGCEGAPEVPYRNAWLYVDPKSVQTETLSKFAPGWDVNLPMACRVVGDKWENRPEAKVTVLPMTIRPSDAALDGELTLQVMLTKGESVKGKAKEGMIGSYFERKVILKVTE